MCFSETQSYFNTFILCLGSVYVYPKWRLAAPLLFLGMKDLLQGLLYKYNDNPKMSNILASLSWIHICFQPLFVNMVLSYFDKKNSKYWNIIFALCFIYGLYTITTLNEFDIQNDKDCTIPNEDYCSPKTKGYIGKYHVGYKFSRDEGNIIFPLFYIILMFIPALFTKSKLLVVGWAISVLFIRYVFSNVRSGESAAIWCFLSIIYLLPVALFNKNISNFLN